MKWDQVKHNWLSVSQQVKLKWGKFTDEDLAMISGQREAFTRLLAQRYGLEQAMAETKVDAFVLGLKVQPELTKIISWSQRCWESFRSCIHVQPRG